MIAIEHNLDIPQVTSWSISSFGTVVQSGIEPRPASTTLFRKQWDRTPGFSAKRKARVYLETLYFHLRKCTILYPRGRMSFWGDGSPYEVNTCTPLPNGGSPGQYMTLPITYEVDISQELEDEILNKLAIEALGLLKDQKVNLAQAFAERRQTADLLYTTAVRAAQSFKYLKRGDLYHAAEALGVTASAGMFREYTRRYQRSPAKAAASYWLELKYGWEPLLQDVYGSAQLIAQKFERERPSSVSARTSSLWVERKLQDGGLGNALRAVENIQRRYKGKLSLHYREDDPNGHTLAQVGVLNPVLLAWELMPYSFVVDWAVGIGSYLQTLDAAVGLSFVSGTFSYKYWMHNDHQCSGRSAGGVTYVGDFVGSSHTEVVHRKKLTSFPSVSFPSFKNPTSFIHASNALALLTTAFGGPSGTQPRYR